MQKKKVTVTEETHFTIYQRMVRLRLLPTKKQMMQVGYDVKKLHDETFPDVTFTYQKEEQELPDQKNTRFFEVRWYSKEKRDFVKEVDAILKAVDCPKKKRERKKTYVSTRDESVKERRTF
ncbi:hypothetical protein K4L44_00510 [Halosquirtibacter laminarini]|uniref:Uncharacterized protein n=1 Tax=Halosquirtibacter laminarini TaxID=3374600 RepID=A0AC61NP00_9BACT|nr:hypothetical protein K4L44_00510 [Prolixibacteraceae bacterium]